MNVKGSISLSFELDVLKHIATPWQKATAELGETGRQSQKGVVPYRKASQPRGLVVVWSLKCSLEGLACILQLPKVLVFHVSRKRGPKSTMKCVEGCVRRVFVSRGACMISGVCVCCLMKLRWPQVFCRVACLWPKSRGSRESDLV